MIKIFQSYLLIVHILIKCKFKTILVLLPRRYFNINLKLATKILNTYIPLMLYLRRGSRGISDCPPRRSNPSPRFINIILLWVIMHIETGDSPTLSFASFYDSHGRKREGLFFYFVPDSKGEKKLRIKNYITTS
jgi:hypothetical protein